MLKFIKFLWNILFLFTIIIFISYFSPNILKKIFNNFNLTDNQLNAYVLLLEILLSASFQIYCFLDKETQKKRCIYHFSIEKDNLSLEGYRRFPTKIENLYKYDYRRNSNDIEKPYYGMDVKFEEKAICSVGIPLCMEVSTSLDGESISFSNLMVYARRYGQVKKGEKLSEGIIIEEPIQDGKKFLIRIQLLCKRQLEKELLNSCIYLTFVLTLTDARKQKHNKYIFLEVQNTIGESRILSISSKNNWFSYIEKLVKQQHMLY